MWCYGKQTVFWYELVAQTAEHGKQFITPFCCELQCQTLTEQFFLHWSPFLPEFLAVQSPFAFSLRFVNTV
jgi:hypothetical protein